MAVATVVEHHTDSRTAYDAVYGAWWFKAGWGLTVGLSLYIIYIYKLWRRKALCLLHASFVVILAGALTTSLTSRQGFIHLRQGEATRQFWEPTADGAFFTNAPLPFQLRLTDFRVDYDADGTTPSDYVSTVVLQADGETDTTTISMNCIGRCRGYRLYQTSFDDDRGGSTFAVGYDPFGIAITYLGYALLALSMMLVTAGRRAGTPRPSTMPHSSALHPCPADASPHSSAIQQCPADGFPCDEPADAAPPSRWLTVVFWTLGILLALYMVVALAFRPLVPVLRSPLLVVHVGVIMVSYVLLVVSIVRRSLLRLAVFMLAAGIFLGAIWANISWGTYWSWDPKESWALITLLVYSLPLHPRLLPWLQSPLHYRLYSLFALLVLLMTYFGVNFFLTGLHSYAN